MDSFRAVEKLSDQGYEKTFAPTLAASSGVASLEPVSTMMISSTISLIPSMHGTMFFSSFFTIMQRESLAMGLVSLFFTRSILSLINELFGSADNAL